MLVGASLSFEFVRVAFLLLVLVSLMKFSSVSVGSCSIYPGVCTLKCHWKSTNENLKNGTRSGVQRSWNTSLTAVRDKVGAQRA